MSEYVRVERDGAVLAVTLARPERRNAITVAMYSALADAIETAGRDPDIRAITLRGEGQDFAAGNDLADFLATDLRGEEEIPVARLLRVLAGNEVPLIAAVHGNCVGIGTTMLLHCDLVVADDSARFSMPFVDLGLVPEAASSLLFPRIAGRRRAARYLLLAEPFGTDEALEIGLVSHRTENGELAAKLILDREDLFSIVSDSEWPARKQLIDFADTYSRQYRHAFGPRLQTCRWLRRTAYNPRLAEIVILLCSASERFRNRIARATRSGTSELQSLVEPMK